MNRLLIGCVSGWQFWRRRERCLRSWGKEAAGYPDLDWVFIFGCPDVVQIERQGHCLFVPCSNDYEALPIRLRLFHGWAAQQDIDWVFKCDDDIRLSVERLVQYVSRVPPEIEVVGYPVEEHAADDGGADTSGRDLTGLTLFPSGNGCLLRRGISRLVGMELPNVYRWDGGEDLLAGRILRNYGVETRWERERFHILERKGREPSGENNWIYSSPSHKEAQ